jgi:hypothetical protein
VTFRRLDIVAFTPEARLPNDRDELGYVIQPSRSFPDHVWVGVGIGDGVWAFRLPANALILHRRLS